jgi:hypothetical protein
MKEGLTQYSKILEARKTDINFKSMHVSKELVQQFGNLLSSKNEDCLFSVLCHFISNVLESNPDQTRQLFSISLNSAFLRIFRCGGTIVTPGVMTAYNTIVGGFCVMQKRLG